MTTKVADSGWRLASVSVEDFRGVLGSQVYEFNGHPTLIWGPNGVGKSTVALALEWTLFGAFPSNVLSAPKDAFLSPVGAGAKACKGKVIFTRGKSKLVVKRAADADTFIVELDGKKKEDEPARLLLEEQLGLDSDTFVRAVLLQQSKIRGLLLDDVKDRNKALDRLLGMDAAEAMLENIKSKPFKDAAKNWRDDIETTEARFRSQAELLEKRFTVAQKDARENNFLNKDLSGTGLAALYASLSRQLSAVANEYGAPRPAELPSADSVSAARRASAALAKAINQVRLGAEIHQTISMVEKRFGQLEEASETWTDLVEARDDWLKAVNDLIKKHGDSKTIAQGRTELEKQISLLDDQLRTASELRALLSQAQGFFERDGLESCPVCEQGISQPQKVLRSIRERMEALTTKSVRDIEKSLEKATKSHAGVLELERGFKALQADLIAAEKEVEAERKAIMKLLSNDGLLEKKVAAALEKALAETSKQREELSRGMQALEKELTAIAERDRAIRDGLVPFLEAREAVEVHEKEWAKAKKGYANAEKHSDEMDHLATQMETIRKALLAAKDEIASTTLGKAGPRAQALYGKLVQHPLFDRLDVKTTLKANKVDYSFEVSSSTVGKSAREARLVLSDGQLTAAALALFYALAESGQHDLDVLYIDDPTQNLDHQRKEAMAKVLADLAKRKQVVISTQDEDFSILLRDAGFEQSSVVHHIEEWDRRPTVKTTLPKAA